MADPTLAITKTEMDAQIGLYLGYGVDSTAWTASETADIDRIRDAGTAKFYSDYNWCFQEPEATLTTEADEADYDLPDDFGGVVGTFYFAADSGHHELSVVSVGQLLAMVARLDQTGTPRVYAITPKALEDDEMQKWSVRLYPKPDTVYVLTYRYHVQRDALSTSYPYPAGGSDHRQTLIEACLSEAESLLDDTGGVHSHKYQEALARSIRIDGRYRPTNFGYAGDWSDGPAGGVVRDGKLKVNGVFI